MYSRYIDMTLAYHRNEIQKEIYKGSYDVNATQSFLGSSFFGGRRHLRNQATNGLTIVSERGTPHQFLTLTANSTWKEILEHLPSGETAYSQALITCQVFHEKLMKILHNVRAGKYNPNGDGIAYIIHVIEYQVYNYIHKYIYF